MQPQDDTDVGPAGGDFNPSGLRELCRMLEAGGAAEVLDAALLEWPKVRGATLAALAQRDARAARRGVHTTKAVCQILQATALAAHLGESEQRIVDGGLDAVALGIPALFQRYETLLGAARCSLAEALT